MSGINDWSNIEFQLFNDAVGHSPDIFEDQWIQTLYDAALFDHDVSSSDRAAILNSLRDRLEEDYGIDFDDVFDWEGYREAYDSAQV